MPTYEIVRDDETVVFQSAPTRKSLEDNFLLVLRMDNPEHGYTVYKIDDDLNRIGRKKTYLPFNKDEKTQVEFDDRVKGILDNFMEALYNGNLKVKTGYGRINPDGSIEMLGDEDVDMGEDCDNCDHYDDCELPIKKPKGDK